MALVDFICGTGIHEFEIRGRFGEHAVYGGAEPVFREPLFILAFSNRSGSNLLADYMASTGTVVKAQEILNFDTVFDYCESNRISCFPEYIKSMRRLEPGHLTFGMKASLDQMVMLHRLNIMRMFECVKVVHIVREDMLEQAVSYSIAYQTKEWTSLEVSDSPDAPEFLPNVIADRLNDDSQSNAGIPLLCRALRLSYFKTTYEHITQNPRNEITHLMRNLGYTIDGWEPPVPSISKQATEINGRFASLFSDYLTNQILNQG